ncbi:MAG: hypothetical protein AAFP69_05420, partial [Planctomycetota bacterium]
QAAQLHLPSAHSHLLPSPQVQSTVAASSVLQESHLQAAQLHLPSAHSHLLPSPQVQSTVAASSVLQHALSQTQLGQLQSVDAQQSQPSSH